jgi:hypothetical protein
MVKWPAGSLRTLQRRGIGHPGINASAPDTPFGADDRMTHLGWLPDTVDDDLREAFAKDGMQQAVSASDSSCPAPLRKTMGDPPGTFPPFLGSDRSPDALMEMMDGDAQVAPPHADAAAGDRTLLDIGHKDHLARHQGTDSQRLWTYRQSWMSGRATGRPMEDEHPANTVTPRGLRGKDRS